jgi:Periplasmic binding protein/Cytochrome c
MKSMPKFFALFSLFLLANSPTICAEPVVSKNEQIQLGRSLYRGTHAFSAPAKLSQVALPSAACVNCHGLRGEGKYEAGIKVPPVQWQRLLAARGDQASYASAEAIVQAIAAGKGRHQQQLAAPMPQFTLNQQEQAALFAYLGVIGTESEPVSGVTADTITIGSVLPLNGRRAALGRAIQAALEARLTEVNRNGGVFGRKIVLHVADAGDSEDSALQAAKGLMSEGVFALLANFVPDANQALSNIARSQGVPLVASLGLPLYDSKDLYLSYVLPSLLAQSQQLLRDLPHYCSTSNSDTLVLYSAEPRLRELAQQLSELSASPDMHTQAVANVQQIQIALQAHPAAKVIALLPPDLAASLRQQWATGQSDKQCLGTLAALSGNPSNASRVPDLQSLALQTQAKTQQHIEVTVLPMMPLMQAEDVAPLSESQLWVLLADIASQSFIEATSRAGRVLDTAGFMQALGSLQAYKTTSGFSVTFSEKQHHGLNVAYLWNGDYHETANLAP